MISISKQAFAVILLLVPLSMTAQQKETANLFAIGHARTLDTYLSPEHYSGVEARFIRQVSWLREGKHWARQLTSQGFLTYTDTRSKDAKEIGGMYNFRFSWQRKFRPVALGSGTLDVRAGAGPEAYVGFLYNDRNGNNPAQARLAGRLTPEVDLSYRFQLAHKPQTVRWNIAFPLLGLQFSPNYGQSYYEIFTRDNYDHNVCLTWLGNAPTLTHRLTWSIPLRRTVLTVGYLGDYQQVKVNSLKYLSFTHAFVIGWTIGK